MGIYGCISILDLGNIIENVFNAQRPDPCALLTHKYTKKSSEPQPPRQRSQRKSWNAAQRNEELQRRARAVGEVISDFECSISDFFFASCRTCFGTSLAKYRTIPSRLSFGWGTETSSGWLLVKSTTPRQRQKWKARSRTYQSPQLRGRTCNGQRGPQASPERKINQ